MSDELNQRVVEEAQRRRGQQVGSGECYDFARIVLQAAGAQPASHWGPVGPTADYVWGLGLTSPAEAQPGDILQMRNVVITARVTHPDGSWEETIEEFPHHTAIVIENLGDGQLRVLHQNFRRQHRVTEHVLRLNDWTQGVIWVYRPA